MDNVIGVLGATMLSEALKCNCTLTELNLDGMKEREKEREKRGENT